VSPTPSASIHLSSDFSVNQRLMVSASNIHGQMSSVILSGKPSPNGRLGIKAIPQQVFSSGFGSLGS
jgi:hypothetical protein